MSEYQIVEQLRDLNKEFKKQQVEGKLHREEHQPTLRDQFAMAALTGLLAARGTTGNNQSVEVMAYVHADEMLRARAKK